MPSVRPLLTQALAKLLKETPPPSFHKTYGRVLIDFLNDKIATHETSHLSEEEITDFIKEITDFIKHWMFNPDEHCKHSQIMQDLISCHPEIIPCIKQLLHDRINKGITVYGEPLELVMANNSHWRDLIFSNIALLPGNLLFNAHANNSIWYQFLNHCMFPNETRKEIAYQIFTKMPESLKTEQYADVFNTLADTDGFNENESLPLLLLSSDEGRNALLKTTQLNTKN